MVSCKCVQNRVYYYHYYYYYYYTHTHKRKVLTSTQINYQCNWINREPTFMPLESWAWEPKYPSTNLGRQRTGRSWTQRRPKTNKQANKAYHWPLGVVIIERERESFEVSGSQSVEQMEFFGLLGSTQNHTLILRQLNHGIQVHKHVTPVHLRASSQCGHIPSCLELLQGLVAFQDSSFFFFCRVTDLVPFFLSIAVFKFKWFNA